MRYKILLVAAMVLFGLGFYFGILKLDPLALILSSANLAISYFVLTRLNETRATLEKSHSVLATNQRQLAQKLDVLRLEVRKK